MSDSSNEAAVPDLILPEPYATQLLTLCEKLEREVGLSNGATALYWQLSTLAAEHLLPLTIAEDPDAQEVCSKCGIALGDAHDLAWGNGPYEIAPLI